MDQLFFGTLEHPWKHFAWQQAEEQFTLKRDMEIGGPGLLLDARHLCPAAAPEQIRQLRLAESPEPALGAQATNRPPLHTLNVMSYCIQYEGSLASM